MSSERAAKVVKRSDLVSAVVVVLHVSFVLAPVYLAAASGPSVLWPVSWLWFGLSMQGLLNLMHETAHLHVFRSRRANEVLGRWLLGPLMFADFDRYREVHWSHHRNVGKEDDPKYSYKIDIRGWRFLAFVLRSVLLVEAIRKVRYVHGASRPNEKSRGRRSWIVRTALVQSAFAGTLYLVARGDLVNALISAVLTYGFIYFYGILSLTVMAANLRAVAEHQLGQSQLETAGMAALRNLKSGPITWLVFGAYGFSEHATHHLNPSIPYYLLRSESQLLQEQRKLRVPGYVEILATIVRSDEHSPSARPARRMLMF